MCLTHCGHQTGASISSQQLCDRTGIFPAPLLWRCPVHLPISCAGAASATQQMGCGFVPVALRPGTWLGGKRVGIGSGVAYQGRPCVSRRGHTKDPPSPPLCKAEKVQGNVGGRVGQKAKGDVYLRNQM